MAGLLKEKKRQAKTTTQQYELYVQFMENHKEIAIRKESDKTIDHLWDRLSNMSNAGIGPQRTKENWKKIFENWRNILRHKKRKEIIRLNETGGGPEISENQLKPIEERALSAWGNLVLDGITNLEAGFNNNIDNTPVLPISANDNTTTEPVACSSKECTTTKPAPTPSQPKLKKRKNISGGDETLNKILFLEEQKTNKIDEGLHDIADSINNLAEAIYETHK